MDSVVNLADKINEFRSTIESAYRILPGFPYAGFDEILCYEIHSQPVSGFDRMRIGETGLTFKELAEKWGVSVSFLGLVIADHCSRLESAS